jgi:hypothetical protein
MRRNRISVLETAGVGRYQQKTRVDSWGRVFTVMTWWERSITLAWARWWVESQVRFFKNIFLTLLLVLMIIFTITTGNWNFHRHHHQHHVNESTTCVTPRLQRLPAPPLLRVKFSNLSTPVTPTTMTREYAITTNSKTRDDNLRRGASGYF